MRINLLNINKAPPFHHLLPLLLSSTLQTSCHSETTCPQSPPAVVTSAGLINLGNTCYLNAQLQCAYHIPYIRSTILTTPTSPDDDNPALASLRHLFSAITTNSSPSDDDDDGRRRRRPTSTVALCRTLGINVFEQQDSQEFWKLLLPELNLPRLADVYQGAFESYITAADGSGRERRREEGFLDLSIDVASGDVLSSLHEEFNTPELLKESEGNGWRPEKDAPKVDALKGSLLRVPGLPSVLQLHLKRFSFDWMTESMSKINDRVVFPEVLNLKSICTTRDGEEEGGGDESLVTYDLQSVVIHVGEYGRGHYYSYVRPDIREKEWYRFDDDKVTEVSLKEVLADSFGGRADLEEGGDEMTSTQETGGLLKRFFGFLFGGGGDTASNDGGGYGWGGRESCAYMIQYVRRCDWDKLYNV